MSGYKNSITDINGFVGIGAPSPQGILHLNGTSTEAIQQFTTTGTGTSISDGLRIGLVGATAYFLLRENAPMLFHTNNTERMRIDASGNVGIGTSSPVRKLHVAGDGAFTSNLEVGYGNNGGENYLQIGPGRTTNGYAYIDLIGDATYTDYGFRIIRGNTGANAPSDIIHRGTGDFDLITTDAASLVFKTYSAERMRINSDGNIGIGTSDFGLSSYAGWNNLRLGKTGNLFFNTATNTYGFAIGRNFYFASDASFKYLTTDEAERINFQNGEITFSNANSGTEDSGLSWNVNMVLNANGNLGIGTTSPSAKLDISSGLINISNGFGNPNVQDAYRLRFYDNGGVYNDSGIGLDGGAGGEQMWFNSLAGFYWGLGTSGTKMIMTSTGDVGIGTTSPTRKLSVNGSIEAGGKTTYTKYYASVDTTGVVVAALNTFTNGASGLFIFTCAGGDGYQKIVYSCKNVSGTWVTSKDIDEGVNGFDVVASANGATVTFTFKGRSVNQSYSPMVCVEHIGSALNTSYL